MSARPDEIPGEIPGGNPPAADDSPDSQAGTPQGDDSPALAQLWETMASVQAGLKLRQDEARADLEKLEQQRADAWQRALQAEADDDETALQQAHEDLATCERIFEVLTHDLRDPTQPQEPEEPDSLRALKED